MTRTLGPDPIFANCAFWSIIVSLVMFISAYALWRLL